LLQDLKCNWLQHRNFNNTFYSHNHSIYSAINFIYFHCIGCRVIQILTQATCNVIHSLAAILKLSAHRRVQNKKAVYPVQIELMMSTDYYCFRMRRHCCAN